MTDLTENPVWVDGVYQLELIDPVVGGAGGLSNQQPQQLANRTAYLKQRLEAVQSGFEGHEAAPDPHPQYTTDVEVAAMIEGELAKLDHKNSVRIATTASITLSGTQTIDGITLVAGDRVLVKNQTTAAGNGIYVVAAGAWSRAPDADASAEVTSGLVVAVEQGTALADTRWQLVTDGAIVLGTTELIFQNITKGFAALESPILTGNPKTPTPAQFDNSSSIMSTDFAKRMGVEYSNFNSINSSTVLTASSIGGFVSAASAAAINVTLPPTAGVPHGATVLVANAGTGAVTLLASITDLTTNQSGATVPIVLGLGDSAQFVKVTGEWRLFGGSISLKYAAGFSSSLAVNGYKKIPDSSSPTGFIIEQWATLTTGAGGQAVGSWPLTFPNAVLSTVCSQLFTTVPNAYAAIGACTASTISCWTSTGGAAQTIKIIGRGY